MLAAVQNGDAKEVAELIRQDPGFNVNMDLDGCGNTFLHFACLQGSRSVVIPLLLAHPDIDVNVKDIGLCTPFFLACLNAYPSCVRELLKDSRVDVNEPDKDGQTPLWWAGYYGYIDLIMWLIASGREMDLGDSEDVWTDVIGMAKKWGKTEVVSLLERFKGDATQTRHVMRVELGWYDEVAAEMFAVVVFVSDGLLQVKDTTTPSPAARFFHITRSLLLELQMVLRYRVVGSAKEIIPGKESEVAFKDLTKRLW